MNCNRLIFNNIIWKNPCSDKKFCPRGAIRIEEIGVHREVVNVNNIL